MAIQEYDFVIKYYKATESHSKSLSNGRKRGTYTLKHLVKIRSIKYEILQDLKQRLCNLVTEQEQDPSISNMKDNLRQRGHP